MTRFLKGKGFRRFPCFSDTFVANTPQLDGRETLKAFLLYIIIVDWTACSSKAFSGDMVEIQEAPSALRS